MTERLYWRDAYLKEFQGNVLSINGNGVVLDQTAFYPRGGGLISDIGILDGVPVTEVTKEEDSIVHVLAQPARSQVGAVVTGQIDWEQRYRMMKMHTAAHIVSSVVNRETGALITGNQLKPDESRIDLSLEQFDREKISSYIEMANDAVKRGLEVRTYFMKRDDALNTPGLVKLANAMPPSVEELRIVQIGDVDTQADGGVHVANTREIGEIVALRAENKGKSNRRLYFTLR